MIIQSIFFNGKPEEVSSSLAYWLAQMQLPNTHTLEIVTTMQSQSYSEGLRQTVITIAILYRTNPI